MSAALVRVGGGGRRRAPGVRAGGPGGGLSPRASVPALWPLATCGLLSGAGPFPYSQVPGWLDLLVSLMSDVPTIQLTGRAVLGCHVADPAHERMLAALPVTVRLGCLPPRPLMSKYLVWLDDHFEPARAPTP